MQPTASICKVKMYDYMETNSGNCGSKANHSDYVAFDEARMNEIRSVVRIWFRKMKNINVKHSSHALKYAMENYLGRERIWDGAVDGFVSTEEMILAMEQEGFDVKMDGEEAYFNISEIDFDAFRVVGSNNETQWHIPHTHVTLRRILEVEKDAIGAYVAERYRLRRKRGFEKYRKPQIIVK